MLPIDRRIRHAQTTSERVTVGTCQRFSSCESDEEPGDESSANDGTDDPRTPEAQLISLDATPLPVSPSSSRVLCQRGG
jgi:hypothetical protein